MQTQGEMACPVLPKLFYCQPQLLFYAQHPMFNHQSLYSSTVDYAAKILYIQHQVVKVTMTVWFYPCNDVRSNHFMYTILKFFTSLQKGLVVRDALKVHTFGMFVSFRMLTLIFKLTDNAKQD